MPSKSSERGSVSVITSMIKLSVAAGVLVAGVLIPPTAFVALTTTTVAREIEAFPMALQEAPIPERTRVLDADGRTLAYFYEQNRQSVPLDEVAEVMHDSILAIEDQRFYEHGALDVQGTLRAFVNNVTGQRVQGGSTITQQLVKMMLVQQAATPEERQAATEETYTRKIRELKFAINYEQEHTKEEILENYLNIAYFGNGAYGISSASRHFFSVPHTELSLTQAATLAGLVRNPVGYDPTVYPERALQRRNTVLSVMRNQGVISRDEADEAMAEPLGLDITTFANGCTSSYGAFFCDYTRRYLLADEDLGDTVEERQSKLEAGGLIIHTTIDRDIQRHANAAAEGHVNATENRIGALGMIEPGTGNVRALAQSRPMGRDEDVGQTFINYTVPSEFGDSNGFQPGSTFKFFTLVAALEGGMSPGQSYGSPDRITMPAGSYQTCEGLNVGEWSPRNSTGSGTFNMYTGMRQSVNTYFAQLQRDAGLCETVTAAEDMGINVPDRDQVGPFTLGVTDTSVLSVAAAYASAASGGEYCEPRPITKITDQSGEIVKEYAQDCNRVMSQGTAATVNDILAGVQRPGGFGARFALGMPSAAKTGTTNDNKAVWYVGYTPNLATAAMVAGADQQGRPISLPGRAFGSTIAAPMWFDAMRPIVTDGLIDSADFGSPPRPEPRPQPRSQPQQDNDGDSADDGDGDGDGDNAETSARRERQAQAGD